MVLPSPGVPARHPVFDLAARARVPVWSEFELAARWSDLPTVAITGTNGKTTVTTLVTDMLVRAGRRTTAAGNTDVPLVDVLDAGLDVVVVEASSFRLALTESFHPWVAAWLNVAEDHLDWHRSAEDYIAAKARIWSNLGAGDVAVANADDPVVAASRRGTSDASGGSLCQGPPTGGGTASGAVWPGRPARSSMSRTCPAGCPTISPTPWPPSACAIAAGAEPAHCAAALREFVGLRPPGRAGRRGRRGALVRRLESDDPGVSAGRGRAGSTRWS